MKIGQTLRGVIDIAELKVQLQTAEQAVSAAREALTRFDERVASSLMLEAEDSDAAAASASGPRLIPVVDWPKYHPWPKLGGLRHLIFHAKENGFEQVIRKIGDRVLISEQAFFEWAERQTMDPSAAKDGPTPRSRSRRTRRA